MLDVPGYLPTSMSEVPGYLLGHGRHRQVSTWDNITGVFSRVYTLVAPAGCLPGYERCTPGYDVRVC